MENILKFYFKKYKLRLIENNYSLLYVFLKLINILSNNLTHRKQVSVLKLIQIKFLSLKLAFFPSITNYDRRFKNKI